MYASTNFLNAQLCSVNYTYEENEKNVIKM